MGTTITLRAWIEEIGQKHVSNLFEVDHSTVSYWASGRNLPSPYYMRAIKKASRGRVTYSEMIETHLKRNSGKDIN